MANGVGECSRQFALGGRPFASLAALTLCEPMKHSQQIALHHRSLPRTHRFGKRLALHKFVEQRDRPPVRFTGEKMFGIRPERRIEEIIDRCIRFRCSYN